MRKMISVICLVVMCAWASPAHAWMWEVADEELAQVTGEGFSTFTLVDGIARASFNVNVSTYAEIESMKLGYYTNPEGNTGWDQNWTGVNLGTSTTDLVIKGVYIEAKFTNLTDPATRQLDYIKVGTNDMTGPIRANFRSISGTITTTAGRNLLTDPLCFGRSSESRQNLGTWTIYSNNSAFSIKLDKAKGWWIDWNNVTYSALPPL